MTVKTLDDLMNDWEAERLEEIARDEARRNAAAERARILWLEADPSREALVEAILDHAESNGFLANMREAIARLHILTPAQEAKAWEVLDAIVEERSAPKTGGWRWLGGIGQRIEFMATVTRCQWRGYLRGGSSDMHIYEMVTEGGHTLAYFGQKHDLVVGERIYVTGTVKRHVEFKGKKSTVISRPKFTKL
jgi:hypothetical protein